MKNTIHAAFFLMGSLFASAASAQPQALHSIADASATLYISSPSGPSIVSAPLQVAGLDAGQMPVALGMRNSNGKLYVLGYDTLKAEGELYTIASSGDAYTATPVSGTITWLDLGAVADIDRGKVAINDNIITLLGRNGNDYIIDADNGTLRPAGIGDISDNINDLLVYPNPVIDQTHVVLGIASISNVYADIIDFNGVVERSQQFAPGTDVLLVDMSDMPQGMYNVRVYGKGIEAHNLKVVKVE